MNREIVFRRRRPEAVAELLTAAGLELRLRTVREPVDYPSLSEQTPQAYLLARRPLTE